MFGGNKIISIFVVAVFFLHLIKSTEAVPSIGTYYWTGKSCANDGETICDFDDGNNWSIEGENLPASPKDAIDYFDVQIVGSNFNYSILATKSTGYKINNLYVGYASKKSVEAYDPTSIGVKLTIQGTSNPDIAHMMLGINCKVVFDTNIKVGIVKTDQIYFRENSILEVKKTFSTNGTFYAYAEGEGNSYNPQIYIHDGATFSYLVGEGGNPFQTASGYIDWYIAGTLNAPNSACKAQDGYQSAWDLYFRGLNAKLNCSSVEMIGWNSEGRITEPTEVSIYNFIGYPGTFRFVASGVIINVHLNYFEGSSATSSKLTADDGTIRFYCDSSVEFLEYSEVVIDNRGVIEMHTDIHTRPYTKKKGYSSSFIVNGGILKFFKGYETDFPYHVNMYNTTGLSEVYFYGPVIANEGSYFNFLVKGHAEIHHNYTNDRLESSDGSSIVIGDGYINTNYPTKFIGGSLNIAGATFNMGTSLDGVSFTGYATINGITTVVNSKINLSVVSPSVITINGNLQINSSEIVLFATSSSAADNTYIFVDGNVSFTDTTFKFNFDGVSLPSSPLEYTLLTYSGDSTGIPTNITLPSIAGATLVYQHVTNTNPKVVKISYTPPPSPPVEPPTEPTPESPSNGPTPPTGVPTNSPSSSNRIGTSLIFVFISFTLLAIKSIKF